jgi:hypothetical protein
VDPNFDKTSTTNVKQWSAQMSFKRYTVIKTGTLVASYSTSEEAIRHAKRFKYGIIEVFDTKCGLLWKMNHPRVSSESHEAFLARCDRWMARHPNARGYPV